MTTATSALDAFITALKSKTAVTSLLNGNSNAIFSQGRVKGGQASPYITVGELMTRGRPTTPHIIITMRVRVYFGDQQGMASMAPLSQIVPVVKEQMHMADLGDIARIGFMDCRWNGYQSPDMFDYALRHYYQEVRFDIYAGHSL